MGGHRAGLIKAVHAKARDLGLDEASRRGLQEYVTGHASTSDMDARQLRAVLAELDRRAGRGGQRRDELPDTPLAKVAVALWLSAWNLGIVADPSKPALCAYVRRQTGLDAARWAAHAHEQRKVVEGLKKMLTRAAGVDWRPFGVAGEFRPDLRVLQAQVRIVEERGLRTEQPMVVDGLSDPRLWTQDVVRHWQKELGRVIRAANEEGASA